MRTGTETSCSSIGSSSIGGSSGSGHDVHTGYGSNAVAIGNVDENSLTASTVSLLGQQQRHDRSHVVSATAAAAKRSPATGIAANANSMPCTHFVYPRSTSRFFSPTKPTKLLLPYAARRHNHNRIVAVTPAKPPAIKPTATTTRTRTAAVAAAAKSRSAKPKQAATKVINQLHAIRIMRRPRLWQQQQQQHDANAVDSSTNAQQQVADVQQQQQQEQGSGIKQKAKDFIIEYVNGSSIHGFVYLAKIGLNIIERMLWLAFICIALYSIISLSQRTWQRFQTSPMVISMDRNKLVWNTSFPSLTVCPHKRIDELKVDEYMIDNPAHFETEADKENFRDFIIKLASLSYDNIEVLPLNNSFGIPSHRYLDVLYELKWHFEPEISSGAAMKMYIYETQTEFGICHSVNSLVARYNSFEYWRRNEWQLMEHGDSVKVHPLDGEIYAQIINLSTAYDVYFHGAADVPIITKQRYTFPETDYTTVELIALEIFTSEDARAFSTKQRKCRYMYEAENMRTVPIYSFGLCLSECRMFFALQVCGCVPHFYRNKLRNGRELPICGLEGIGCLVEIKREIISLKSDRYKINCNCLANCDDSNFFVQTYRSRVWFLGANLQWGIIEYPKMQLRRDVLFSFADVLVYIGGLVGFFLGCSVLSFTEIIYYFTARFVRRILYN